MADSGDEEILREFDEELRKLKVGDLLVQTLYTVSSLGYRRLGDSDRDLEQARLAIDALKALQPLVPEAAGRELQGVVASLQLAFADAAK